MLFGIPLDAFIVCLVMGLRRIIQVVGDHVGDQLLQLVADEHFLSLAELVIQCGVNHYAYARHYIFLATETGNARV